MPKRASPFELLLPLPRAKKAGWRWLYAALRSEILEGRLRPGARLPSTRELAAKFGLARGTIVNAFDQLKAEGYLEGTIGSGTCVSRVLPDEMLHVPTQSAPSLGNGKPPKRILSAYGRRVQILPGLQVRESRAFRPNLPALDLFPAAAWSRIAARVLRHASTDALLGCDAMGYRPLREAIAGYLSASRGVNCTPEQIAIVFGVQDALDLVARLFLNPGDRVCFEDPGYDGARAAFEAFGLKVAHVPLDAEGMRVPSARLRGSRLLYLTPAHQFPTGVTMSLRRRLELLDWARASNALIFEDDYDSEYRYSGSPVPAMQGLDRHGVVLFAGSFSKVLFPSLRLGYIVVPPDLVPYVEAIKSVSSRHAPLLDQMVLCEFITEGHFGRHLRRMREVYAERLSVLVEHSRSRLAGILELSNVEAGLQTAGWLREGIDARAVAKAASARNVEVTPLSVFSSVPLHRDGLQLGFAAVNAAEIRRGVRELAAALESVL